MTFSVGDKVKWNSSNVDKAGEIVAVVPAGSTPSEVGFPKAGGGGLSRDHVTYVIKGKKQQRSYSGATAGQMVADGAPALYWPHVSLLSLA